MIKNIEDRTEQPNKSAKQRLLESPGFLNADTRRMTEETAEILLQEMEEMNQWSKENPNARSYDHPSTPEYIKKEVRAKYPHLITT